MGYCWRLNLNLMLGAKLGILNKSYNIKTNGLVWHQEPGMDKCYPGSTLTYNLANMNISGTLVNDATVTGTVPGRAYVMDGSDDYINEALNTGDAKNLWLNKHWAGAKKGSEGYSKKAAQWNREMEPYDAPFLDEDSKVISSLIKDI